MSKWVWIAIILSLALNVVILCAHKAHSATFDPIVQYIEGAAGIHPGDPLPQDWRTPNIRLQYKNTTSMGNGCYQVNICRYR